MSKISLAQSPAFAHSPSLQETADSLTYAQCADLLNYIVAIRAANEQPKAHEEESAYLLWRMCDFVALDLEGQNMLGASQKMLEILDLNRTHFHSAALEKRCDYLTHTVMRRVEVDLFIH